MRSLKIKERFCCPGLDPSHGVTTPSLAISVERETERETEREIEREGGG